MVNNNNNSACPCTTPTTLHRKHFYGKNLNPLEKSLN